METAGMLTETYAVLPLRDMVMFPDMIVSLSVGRAKSIKALEHAGNTHMLLLVAQKDATKDTPRITDLYKIGVISKILQINKTQDPTLKVYIQGIQRVKVTKFHNHDTFLLADVKPILDEQVADDEREVAALKRSVLEHFGEYVRLNKKINPDVMGSILQTPNLSSFCNAVSAHLTLPVNKKQALLESTFINKKLEQILLCIDSEVEMIKAESRIKSRVRNQIERNQKEYYLNEQLKAIHKELGEEDSKDELDALTKRIKASSMHKEAKHKANSELKKLRLMNPMSSEATVVRNYLDWLLDVPWGKEAELQKDLSASQAVLDSDHYGLEKIKERIIEYLAVNIRTNDLNSPILCLVGPPGVGKTSLARSIAIATSRTFVKIALGGLRDEAEIKGHRRTYIGAMPGKIIQAMKKAKIINPVILLDEIDKLGYDYRGGDPGSALLEVLDPEQNKKFNDHYLEVDYDLSKVMFIATANSTSLPRPLLDRLEVVKLSGYTEDEKVHIAKEHLIPKQAKMHAVKGGELTVEDSAICDIIRYYTREAGVRQLDRDIAKIMRKVVRKNMNNETLEAIIVNSSNIKDFLGVHKFYFGVARQNSRVGITNGLAYTDFGGDLLEIEAVVLRGKGEVKITGKLGDVMKESVQAALSYARQHAAEFGINHEAFKEIDVHVHVPEGATPKDGPSAGVGVSISIVSALTGIPVRSDVAITGEITLSGRVLPIGGLKEKLLAAIRGSIKTVMIPKDNMNDFEEMPDKIKQSLEIVPIENASEALGVALDGAVKPIISPAGSATATNNIIQVTTLQQH